MTQGRSLAKMQMQWMISGDVYHALILVTRSSYENAWVSLILA